MAYPQNVNISMEASNENVIREITYDGQEIYEPPLSMSDNFTRLAQKIDFSKASITDDEPPDVESVDESTSEASASSTSAPWEPIAAKIRNAITEVSVLIDVLNVAKEKRYMVLDPVPQELHDYKPMAQVYSRKKGLQQAASMLLNAAERLRVSQSEATRNRATPDFHIELLRLRQNFRLKKVGNSIIGDLSYRTAGSKFPQTGMFEVSRADEEDAPKDVSVIPRAPSALRVTVPTELQGVAYIMVLCQKDNQNLFDTNVNLMRWSGPTPNADMHWQQALEAAQNVLFCQELFSQLAREAVHLQASIPHMVVANQIIATVLPNIQLVIGLCHSSSSAPTTNDSPNRKAEHDHVLEHSLHQLLREVHHNNTHHPFPHPSSGPLGPSKKRYLAGPAAMDRQQLIEMSKSTTLLEQIIQQTQHFFMRTKVEYALDNIAKQVKDPMIIPHWNSLNTPTQSCVRLTMISSGFDSVCRTSLMIHVLEKTLKCICRDGHVIHLSYESDELSALIYAQICQHQIIGVQNIAKNMGWQLLASTPHLGHGPVQTNGNANCCLLASPIGDRLIAVRCEPQGKVVVHIGHSPRKDFLTGQLVREIKWENLGGPFKEVRWEKMEGKNLLNKIELLMASLTSPP